VVFVRLRRTLGLRLPPRTVWAIALSVVAWDHGFAPYRLGVPRTTFVIDVAGPFPAVTEKVSGAEAAVEVALGSPG
jgi:hypothetical protein